MGGRFLGYLGNAIGFLALVILVVAGYNAWESFPAVSVPDVPDVPEENRVALNEEQGWSDVEARWFHHADQGTRILPEEWFINLQQPILSPDAPLIIEGDFLQGFGFLRSPRDEDFEPRSQPADDPESPNPYDEGLNPHGLPIGFAIDRDFAAPYADPPSTGPVVGLTCAACHTSQLLLDDDKGNLHSVRIEGGSSMINLSAFQQSLRLAVGLTAKIPSRFDRFAGRVLGDESSDESKKQELRDRLNSFVASGLALERVEQENWLQGTDGGFGRTDALSLIGNRVFRQLADENMIAPEAPVNFPHLWDTPWFDWVQYNASIRMPLVRNIGEALGVGAPVDLVGKNGEMFRNTVNVENLHEMEDLLGGDTTLGGLRSPRWDDLARRGLLDPLERPWVDKGADLYAKYCQRCHLPPMETIREHINDDGTLAEGTPGAIANLFDEDAGGPGRLILRLNVVDLLEVGTDPNQAMHFYRRTAAFHGRTLSAARGLYAVTEEIRRRKLGDLGISGPDNPEFIEYNRYRAFTPPGEGEALDGVGMDAVLEPNLGYRVRPLDGIWATPPFLHNGSVPSLAEMLKPAEERTKVFYLGSTRFDEDEVGYETGEISGGFRLDTTLPGNSNAGHEFRNLRLDELESVPELWGDPAVDVLPEPAGDEQTRWARALGLVPEDYAAMSDAEKEKRRTEVTRMALQVPRVMRDHPFPGVLGAEFTEEERRHLIEYLKSL